MEEAWPLGSRKLKTASFREGALDRLRVWIAVEGIFFKPRSHHWYYLGLCLEGLACHIRE